MLSIALPFLVLRAQLNLTHKMEQFYKFNEVTNYPVIIAQLFAGLLTA